MALTQETEPPFISPGSIEELQREELQIPVIVERDGTLRAKITDSCGLACTFCHNEGTPVALKRGSQALRVSIYEDSNGVDFISTDMHADDTFRYALDGIVNAVDTQELHWTGGEPTLSRSIVPLTRIAVNEFGLTVKMTSNGERGSKGLEELAEAGLSGVNFSVFGTTAEELAEVQPTEQLSSGWAERKLDNLLIGVETAKALGMRTTANIVMRNEADSARIERILLLTDPEVLLRVQADLSSQGDGWSAIYKMLLKLGARPVEASITAGTSDAKIKYMLPDGRPVVFKRFLSERLPDTCNGCQYNNDIDCTEGFYGIRLYAERDNKYRVGVCIRRMDLTVPIGEFLSSTLPDEINSFRQAHFDEWSNVPAKKLLERINR